MPKYDITIIIFSLKTIVSKWYQSLKITKYSRFGFPENIASIKKERDEALTFSLINWNEVEIQSKTMNTTSQS